LRRKGRGDIVQEKQLGGPVVAGWQQLDKLVKGGWGAGLFQLVGEGGNLEADRKIKSNQANAAGTLGLYGQIEKKMGLWEGGKGKSICLRP